MNELSVATGKPLRFCGRCQTWLPNAIEIHHCVRAPRAIGYAWHEPDEPAFEKNSILQEGRKFKRGDLIRRFESEVAEEVTHNEDAGTNR